MADGGSKPGQSMRRSVAPGASKRYSRASGGQSMNSRSRSSRGGNPGKKSAPTGPQPVVVRDAAGNDVTPRSLLGGDRAVPTGADGQPAGVTDPPAATGVSVSTTNTANGTSQASTIDAKPGKDVSQNLFNSSAGSDSDASAASGLQEDANAPLTSGRTAAAANAAAVAEAISALPLTEEELDAPATIELCETETFWLLDVPGEAVEQGSVAAGEVQAANQAYEALLRKRIDTADMYAMVYIYTYICIYI